MIAVNGIDAVTLADISTASGRSVDSLRKQVERGTLKLTPIATVGTTNLYGLTALQAIVRAGL